MALKTMSIDKLRDLKNKVDAAISTRISDRRRELESGLSKLSGFGGRGKAIKFGGRGWERAGGSKIPQPRELSRDLGGPWPQATLAGCRHQGWQKAGRFPYCRKAQSVSGEAGEKDP
jgi:hypothetical protein